MPVKPTDRRWQDVLATWFGDTRQNPDTIPARMSWWFQANEERDNDLRDRFAGCCEAALGGLLGHWQPQPVSRLALILLLDQFPRNLFRGTPRAFSADDRAAMLCLSGVQAGLDQELAPVERVFFYMPLQHAEDLVTQEVSVGLFEKLAADLPDQPAFKGFAQYARLHRDLIRRFGRFPHRNEILARPSTPEETQYLLEGGQRFGQ